MPGPLPLVEKTQKRLAIETVYVASSTLIDGQKIDIKKLSQKIHTKIGVNAKEILAKVRALPPGLVNNEEEMTLRRATNIALSISGTDQQRSYTNGIPT